MTRLGSVPPDAAEIVDMAKLCEEQELFIEELHAQNDEAKRALEAVEQDLAWYRRLFEIGPEPHLLTDEFGRILEGNHAAAQLLGYDDRMLPGKLLATRFALSDDRRQLRRAMIHAARIREPVTVEVRFDAGARGTTVMQARVLADDSESGIHLSWLLRDITAERMAVGELRELTETLEERVAERTREVERAQEAVELERQRLEVLVQELPVAVLMVDAATEAMLVANQHGRDLLLAATGDTGSRVREVPLQRLDGAEVPLEDRPIMRAFRGELTVGDRFSFQRVEGGSATIEMTASPVRDRVGEVVAGVIVAQDVTDRERRERAEREFLSNAAHQLRTPVAAIQSAIDVLEAGAKDDEAARDRFLGHIARAALGLGRLSQSLLVLARAQSGERPRSELVEVAPLLRELCELARPAANVRIGIRCRRNLVVLANRDLLREALSSLVDNAIRYTREGRIDLRGRRNGGKHVVVEVADTGSGMSAETRERMFERFYGGDVAGSFGLGLAIAKQAAEAIGAEIDVESELGRGTSVRLTLPAGMLRAT